MTAHTASCRFDGHGTGRALLPTGRLLAIVADHGRLMVARVDDRGGLVVANGPKNTTLDLTIWTQP